MLGNLRHPSTILIVVAVFFTLTGGAVAAKLITGKDVQDGSLTGEDVKRGSVDLSSLTARTQALIRRAGLQGQEGETGAPGAKGAQGETGPQGEAGPQGAAGAKGDLGATGATGAKGDAGAQGASGAKGETGATGAQGATGMTGPQGLPGVQGPAGETGATGMTGPQGLPGSQGTDGIDGVNGADGGMGPQGPTGPTGASGPTGPTGTAGQDGETIGDAKAEYGVAKVYKVTGSGHTLVGTLWTGDVPDDRNNAAMASETIAVTGITAGDQIEIRGAVRSEEADLSGGLGFGGHMGGSLVAQDADGSYDAAQTAPASAGDERGTTSTVRVPQLTLGSGGPDQTTGELIVSMTLTADAPAVLVSASIQTFDFFPVTP